MLVKFKNMNELVDYLGTVEQRLAALEMENKQLRAVVPSSIQVDENQISRYLSQALPRTNLFAPSFLKRAFAVWGHFVVANIIIGLGVGLVYFCFAIVVLGMLSNNVSK